MSAPPSPSGDCPEPRRFLPRGGLIVLTAALLFARLWVASAVHLTEDEAYYRLWAQAPALGYFDHPPMVAWWIWAGVHLAGDTPLGVRLLPTLACAVTTFLVFDLAKLAGAGLVDATRAAVWYNATLLVAAGGFLAVPDAPAAFFWVASLWGVSRAARGGRVAWWLLAGGAAGFATISKYSALFLGPGVLIWLLWTPEGRASLKSPGPWLALPLAAAIFGLNVEWNATHHWLTFAKQFGRITPHRFAPRFLAEFLGTEFVLLNPLVASFLARPVPRAAPFLLTSAPFIGYLALHSLHDRIQAHWPAPVFPALAIAAAVGAHGAGGVWARVRSAAPWVAVLVCALAGSYLLAPTLGVRPRFDPALPVEGWPAFSRQIESLRARNDAAWIGVTSYGLAAELMDQPEVTTPILQISERDRWRGLVHGAWADTSRAGLLVDLTRRIDLVALGRCFRTVTPLTVIERGPPGGKTKRYGVLLVAGPRRDVVLQGCGAKQASEGGPD